MILGLLIFLGAFCGFMSAITGNPLIGIAMIAYSIYLYNWKKDLGV